MSLRTYENDALRNLYHVDDDGQPVAAHALSPGDTVCQVAMEASGYGTVVAVYVGSITVLWSKEPNEVGYHYAPYQPLVVTPVLSTPSPGVSWSFVSSDDTRIDDVVGSMQRLFKHMGQKP